jgi:signal-induced proliferation-associated 1 like protein 3
VLPVPVTTVGALLALYPTVVEPALPVLDAAVVEVELPDVPVPVLPEIDTVLLPVVPVPVLPVPVLPVPVLPVPVLLVAVVTPFLVAEFITEEAAADPVVVPRAVLFEPLPSGTLSLRSGTLKVAAPSPVPNVVPITAKRRA